LLNLCANTDNDFSDLDVGNLTFYAVEVRYPDDFYIPTIDEAKECARIANEVMEFVYKKLNVDVNQLKAGK
ncbi:MAG: HEPN domain-containing protein, partial [bacterium]|nr:HEPN domain-containing protein [bacterium]